MPVPVIIWGLLELAGAISTAYEMYDLGCSLYEGVGDYSKNLDEAKKVIKEKIQSIKDEIAQDLDENLERSSLLQWTAMDRALQSEVTREARGRGVASEEIRAAIKENIPFRQVISMVCAQADKIPIVSLRRKRGVQIKDLTQAKKQALLTLLAKTAEELAGIQDIDGFIVARLKQLATSFMFEFMDEMLGWKSPLKAEVCFGPKNEDPKLSGATRLLRTGLKINPFYPAPYRSKGSVSADLAIPDYRKNSLKKENLFAIVEIKFQNDRIDVKQFKRYFEISMNAAKSKERHVTKQKINNRFVLTGCRVSLFRFPEDVAEKKNEASRRDNGRSKKWKGMK